MFVASLKNDYIYVDENNKYIGLNINEFGICNFDYDAYNELITNIRFNNKCFKIATYKDYDVYFNPVTNYKHYIKDGIEDYLMFYLKNGSDGLLYNDIGDKKSKFNSKIKRFIIGSTIIICSSLFISSLLVPTISRIIDYKSFTKDDSSFETVVSYDDVSVEDYIQMINNSPNLNEEEKKILANKQLLEDLKPYYDNSYMKHLINWKLKDIDVSYFKRIINSEDILGYYNGLNLNEIHLSDEFRDNDYGILNKEDSYNDKYDTFTHEYINLLQASGGYRYIDEAVAEIMSYEYYDTPIDTYLDAVKNIELLIEIIGPEPILDCSFGGKSDNLKNILADNLSFDDYKSIMKYFSKAPSSVSIKENSHIKEILCTLYKNIYNRDIRDDEDILYEYLYSNDLYYLCTRRYLSKDAIMNEENMFLVYFIEDKDFLCEHNLIKNVKKRIIQQSSSLDEYLYNNKDDIYIHLDNPDIKLEEDVLYYKGQYIKLEDASKKGYISFWRLKYINVDERVPEGWIYSSGSEFDDYVTKFDSLYIYNVDDTSIDFAFCGKGLKSRFDINYKSNKNKSVNM